MDPRVKSARGGRGWRGADSNRTETATSIQRRIDMPDNQTARSEFSRAMGDAKKQAGGVVNELSGAAQDLYDQAVDSGSQAASATKTAAQKTAGSFEKALRSLIEEQPYTAVLMAVGIGWLLGRIHRPL
jgi:ElaB/YqjD/DUF883 family membrane-anchored ribosome-binding protein